MIKAHVYLAISVLFTNVQFAYANDRVELDPTRIIGNSELPKVLTIIPWKKPPLLEWDIEFDARFVEFKPKPITRDVFLREINFKQQLSNAPQ